MNALVFWLAVVLALLLLGQVALGLGYVALMWRARRRIADDSACPPATVLLCLRGTDPFLPEVLQGIFDLDYPRFDVRVVVDHRDDPAWQVVERAAALRPDRRVVIETLERPLATCSLKCASVAQAIGRLDPQCEVVALIDADTLPHRNWLRELVAPLADPGVGATSGNRWYMPEDGSLGSLVRYMWNACAVVQMQVYAIPWGGSLAIRTSVLADGQIVERWQNAFCEDTMMSRRLAERQLRVARVPALMMINREATSLGGFFRWVRRQLLTARLYHPRWLAVAGHGLATSVALAAMGMVGLLAVVRGEWSVAQAAASTLVGYFAVLLLLLPPMELAMRRIAAERGERTDWLSPRALVSLLVAAPLTSVVYAGAILSSLWLRRVDWRGVEYEVRGPWQIRLVEYLPYAESSSAETAQSL